MYNPDKNVLDNKTSEEDGRSLLQIPRENNNKDKDIRSNINCEFVTEIQAVIRFNLFAPAQNEPFSILIAHIVVAIFLQI